MPTRHEKLRELPKIDELMRRQDVVSIRAPRVVIRQALRDEVERVRNEILAGVENAAFSVDRVESQVQATWTRSIQNVVNGTGVVLHTNLGRAPLSRGALDALVQVASGYSNLEYDLAKGARGSRHHHVDAWICELTGAEDAVVVNNCAAAVMLGLAALGSDREVIVSRGELIEIGGSFRVPDIMRLSRAKLIEVGTTNKTRLADYRRAITENTGLLAKIHRSNFAMVGFTEETSVEELAALAHEHGIPVMMDLGSGVLVTPERQGELSLQGEPSVRDAVDAGADVVCFSGDKLLGGPQCGVLAGKAATIERCRRHPLMRAMRPDKLALVALEATLRDIIEHGGDNLPVHRMLAAPADELESRRAEIRAQVSSNLQKLKLIDVALDSTVGGGTMPQRMLPSVGLGVQGASADAIESLMRRQSPPVVGRILDDTYCLDMRTLFRPEDRQACVQALAACDQSLAPRSSTRPG